jgi:hypothetical protein
MDSRWTNESSRIKAISNFKFFWFFVEPSYKIRPMYYLDRDQVTGEVVDARMKKTCKNVG